jgi:hypothetical protein
MKKFYILIFTLFVVASSCQRSQFSTTTRHTKNGKVTYINNYHKERSKISKGKSHKSYPKETEVQNTRSAIDKTELKYLPEHEITEINPVLMQDYENLIASTSNEPAIWVNKDQVISNDDMILPYHNHIGIKKDNFPPDSIKFIAPQQGTTMDLSAEYVIKLKNGSKKTVGLIYQSHDTLFYRLISSSKTTGFVTVEQVDTIFKVKYYDSTKGQVVDTRKSVKLGTVGFIFSLLGIIPFIGLPFAIAAVIFGAVSLHKIKRHPEQYRGINNAYASIVLGILGIAVSTIIILAYAMSGGGSVSMGMGQ